MLWNDPRQKVNPMRYLLLFAIAICHATAVQWAVAEDGGESVVEEESSVLRTAIQRSLVLLERASAGSADERKCFTCHSQALPVFAIASARRAGFEVDSHNFERQISHTLKHLKGTKKSFFEGKGPGGGVDTAGYALWTLEDGDHEADEVTTYVTDWILKEQAEDGRWNCRSDRPPSESSDFTTTYVAVRALNRFAGEDRQSVVADSFERASVWLRDTKPRDTEDRVFRLLSFDYVDADPPTVDSAIAGLSQSQREDGGWSQTDELESDAYATSIAMYALSRFGVDRQSDSWQLGLRFLLDQQHHDGSWHVVSRSKPFQKYFESGFPHGQDQFISTTATAWATIVLVESLPNDH
jgi:hypothetical protein